MSISYYNSLLSDDSKCAQFKLPSSSVQVLHFGELRHGSVAIFREKMVFRVLIGLDEPISSKFGTNIEAINIKQTKSQNCISIENWSFALAQYVQHINELWNPIKSRVVV